jgi:mono/diheme cytochrome c family protein
VPVRRRGGSRGPGAALLVAVAGAALAGCNLLPQRSEGEKLWRARCAECHGLDGSGNTPMYMGQPNADLLDDGWEHGGEPGSWEIVIREGLFGQMPGNPDLTREQVRALVQYLRQLRGEAAKRPGG